MAEASNELTLLDAEPGCFRFSRWQNVTIGVWHGQATRDSAQRVYEHTLRLAADNPTGHSNVTIMVDGMPVPDPAAAAIFRRLQDREVGGVACFALVLEGSGFWASAMRSFMTALRIMAPRSMAFRMFASVESVSAWLVPAHLAATGVALDAGALASALRDERAAASWPTPPRQAGVVVSSRR